MGRRFLRSWLGFSLSASLLTAVVTGCGSDKPPATSDDPDASDTDAGPDDLDASTEDAGPDDLDASTEDASIDGASPDPDASVDDAGPDAEVDPDPALADALFTHEGIARIDLTVDQAGLDVLGMELDPRPYVHAALRVELADQSVHSFEDIAVRLKGGLGSGRLISQKAAFLLKINEYVKGQKLLSMTKLALNNMVQDPSMVREQLAYELFREADVPAPRTSYARVYVNDTLYGLYATVEVLDNKEFLSHWFGSDDGNLYEGEYGADLESGLVSSFDQDRGTDVDFADLQELTTALDGFSPPAEFVTDASTVIDMDRYIQFAATELFVAHWDGYAWSRNNYYLFRLPEGRWTFMPWGVDQAFELDLNPFGGEGRVEQLCKASVPCRERLAAALEQVAQRVEDLDLEGRVDDLRALIEDAMQEDPRKEHDADAVHAAMDATKLFLAERENQIAGPLLMCTDPSDTDVDGDDSSGCDADCNDQDENIYPGATDTCNGKDDDCDDQVDEDPLCPACNNVAAVGGGTFALCVRPKTQAAAEAHCVTQGGHLASIHSQAQQDQLASATAAIVDAPWYIGFSDTATEGTFVWVDATSVDFENWNDGEPNDYGAIEDYTAMVSGTGGWNDVDGEVELRYICKLP